MSKIRNLLESKKNILYSNNRGSDSVIYPSIDKLLNIVDSKYKLVHIASRRSKQMLQNKHFQMKQEEYVNKKELGRALEEVEKGLITIKQ